MSSLLVMLGILCKHHSWLRRAIRFFINWCVICQAWVGMDMQIDLVPLSQISMSSLNSPSRRFGVDWLDSVLCKPCIGAAWSPLKYNGYEYFTVQGVLKDTFQLQPVQVLVLAAFVDKVSTQKSVLATARWFPNLDSGCTHTQNET